MHTRISWLKDGITFAGEDDKGHLLVMDGPENAGGKDLGFRPMELILIGAGGCMSIDVLQILKNSNQDITSCICDVSAERAETDPKVFTRIHFHFSINGNNLREQYVERAIQSSATKYCSATNMLAKTAEITHDFDISERTKLEIN
ncbi:MAG: OsmC family protein [Proteobacteria bacterium]|nr:OsmC family protein [Pseudomonadota bacterium]MDE3208053.1 OsmC family protein [Pseudomonadota bacterium]